MHIDDYAFGRIVVDGREETRDVILTPDGIHPNWWRDEGHALSLDDLEIVVESAPEVLVVGTGAQGQMRPDPGLEETLAQRGIRMEAMPTDQAVERANELFRDGAKAAVTLHLTC